MKKKNLLTLLLVVIIFLLFACGDNQDETREPISSDQEEFLWQISIIKAETATNLASTQTFIQYDGVAEEVPYEKTSAEGYMFLLLELNIDKKDTGGQPFKWENAYVLDAEGNKYYRHENDTFLEDYNIPRIKATNLTLGGNSGCVCYEIPAAIDTTKLTFIHEAEEGQNSIAIGLNV